MSRENVDLIRGLMPGPDLDMVHLVRDEAAATAMMAAFAPLVHDDFDVVAVAAVRDRYAGVAGLRAAWLDWLEPWASYRTEMERAIDAGDDVVMLTRDYGRRAGTDAEVCLLGAAVWTVRGGRIARVAFHASRAEALEAVGLSSD